MGEKLKWLYKDKVWLEQKYIVEKLSQKEIAKICNVSYGCIQKNLTKHGLNPGVKGSRYQREETKEKIRLLNTGKKHSKEINLTKGRKGHIVTEEMRRKISESRLGEKHPLWKGGVTSLRRLLVGSAKYKAFRSKMFKRDNYMCQNCGHIGGYIHLHHIIPQSKNKDLIMNENNVKTLCLDCHVEEHPNINVVHAWVR